MKNNCLKNAWNNQRKTFWQLQQPDQRVCDKQHIQDLLYVLLLMVHSEKKTGFKNEDYLMLGQIVG